MPGDEEFVQNIHLTVLYHVIAFICVVCALLVRLLLNAADGSI